MVSFSTCWRNLMARQSRLRTNESPLRAELFSSEQLQRHAVTLAQQHELDPRTGPNRLLLRLADNEQTIVQAYDLMAGAEAQGGSVPAAGEWLLDNYYLIEQQIRLTRLHLPRTYSRELPRLLTGSRAGFPRVYDIALELISHVDGRIDRENVSHVIRAYQSIAPLTLGELWAVPIMLRLGLIENLRRVSAHIAQRRLDRNLATAWAGRLLVAAENEPATVLGLLAEMARSDPPFSSQFVEEFCGRLHGQSPLLATVESWVQHHLIEQGLTREQLQRADNQNTAADQVSIGNSISSLRFLSAMDWREFVEDMSIVEQTLLTDPAGVYADMDFVTRDRYRQCVEGISRQSGITEQAVAHTAIELATEAASREGLAGRTAHVGFYLIDKGQPLLERMVRVRWSLRRTLTRTIRRFPSVCYLSCISAITAAGACLGLGSVSFLGWHDWRFWLLLILVTTAASQVAVALVNLLTSVMLGPRRLPRLDFSEGIPDRDRTMVVVPTLLTSPQAIADLIESLEIRYLGNRDPNLLFGLLTDFIDATEEAQPDDAELLRLVREGIQSLNARYSAEGVTVFHLFHRPRVWNPHERLWMGYERKRGKLEQFNALLRGGPRDQFDEIIGDLEILPSIRYVLTLDTDTGLPRDAARKLIGTIAHPLNRPRLDPIAGRVVEGYAILQPRTPIGLLSANRSRFAQLSAGEAGIDPYTRDVSDVYQDLFAEGSYVGKGIYDVDAFRQVTAGRFPENLILSHDLLESGYARSALVTDVELHEDHPASFAAEMSRRHRWIRGDWQIAGWLLPRVLGPTTKRLPNTLTALGWWKIFDNLRRSLIPPALVMLLLCGWLMAPEPTGFWTLFVLLLLLLPVLTATLAELLRKPRERTWAIHLDTVLKSLGRQMAEAGLMLSTLPYRAVIHLDAIAVSGVRMLFTRRGLLLWHTPRYARRNGCTTLIGFVQEMWVAPIFAAAAAAGLALTRPAELTVSGPLLLLWLLSPVIGWWISRPITVRQPVLSEAQQTFLRGLSRQTWHYFEVLVNAEENWLPPDNFQEVPTPVAAARTSPTNIGMTLLANLAAGDFGYLLRRPIA
jgi:cyclic beta-1,2-glucan synthetase